MSENKRKGGKNYNKIEGIKQNDIFGETVGFNFSEDSSDYKSLPGLFITCLVFTITVLFTVQNIIILRDRNGTLFTSALKTNYNGEDRIFTEDDGFQMAIAIADGRTFPSYTDP